MSSHQLRVGYWLFIGLVTITLFVPPDAEWVTPVMFLSAIILRCTAAIVEALGK